MNTINGNFIENSIPDTKNATIALNIGGVDSTMSVANFATAIASPAPYKVFTALLTQSGGDDPQDLCLGAVTKGVTYTIDGTGINADFSNVGGPKFEGTIINGTSFVATNNNTPNNYDEGCLLFNTGAPVVTVLENTIGNVWFSYNGVGNYFINSNGLFINNKTYSINSQTRCLSYGDSFYSLLILPGDNNNLFRVLTLDDDPNAVNDMLIEKMIEIRVYN